MKRLAIIIIILLCCCSKPVEEPEPVDTACYEGYCFELELAVTQYQQALGLSFRDRLEPDHGMLFIFEDEGIYQFWMKDTKIRLDIIWLDRNGQVLYIKKNAEPCTPDYCPTINPGRIAKYVLEINGGMSDSIGLELGDRIDIDIQTIIK